MRPSRIVVGGWAFLSFFFSFCGHFCSGSGFCIHVARFFCLLDRSWCFGMDERMYDYDDDWTGLDWVGDDGIPT